MTVARHLSPAQLRLALRPAGGEPVATVTVPFRAPATVTAVAGAGSPVLVVPADLRTSRLVFEPAALAEGEYAVEVELLDGDGRSLAAETARFRRAPGP